MTLTILAQITAAPGKEALVRAELKKLVPISRTEKGMPPVRPTHERASSHCDLAATEGAASNFVLNEMSNIA